MKIIFDLRSVGLGNNGGSSTLIKSGNTLVDLGHDVIFMDTMKNMHTWVPLKAKHIIRKGNESGRPKADAIIATGYKSVFPTIKAPPRCGSKFHWIRAWETWQMSDDEIVNKVLNVPTIKLVNSICLQNKLKSYGVDSYIVRPGYDFEMLYPMNTRQNKKEIIIGGLYRAGTHGKRKRTQWLFDTAKAIKSKHSNVKLWLFGSEKFPNNTLIDKYIRGPSMEEKNEFFNMVDVWMAPTMSEGLHLPPAEAMITECPIVATDAELSGTQDYTIHNKTGIVSKNNIDSFIECVNLLVEDESMRLRLGKNARDRILEIGDRETNMKKMILLFEEIAKK